MLISDGTALEPISVTARNSRQALLHALPGGARVLQVRECQHWRLDGLAIQGTDDETASPGHLVEVRDAQDIVVSNFLLSDTNRYANAAALHIAGSQRILVEGAELYRFHMNGIWSLSSQDVEVRRSYFHGGGYPDIAGGFVSNYPARGDVGVYILRSDRITVEDVLGEGCYHGVLDIARSETAARVALTSRTRPTGASPSQTWTQRPTAGPTSPTTQTLSPASRRTQRWPIAS